MSSVISGIFAVIYFIIVVDIVSGLLMFFGFNVDNIVFRFFRDVGDVFLSPGMIIFEKLKIETGMIDFSPMLSLFLLEMIERVLLSVLK